MAAHGERSRQLPRKLATSAQGRRAKRHMWPMRSSEAWTKAAISKGGTSRSSIAGRSCTTIACQR